jgi:predicted nuclease with TOPRIM domain
MRIIHNTHSKSKLSDAATLKINFADPAKPTISPLDEAQSYETYFKMGVMSPVDILMQKDKDLRSREEALERLKIIKSETQQLVPPDVKQENENGGTK